MMLVGFTVGVLRTYQLRWIDIILQVIAWGTWGFNVFYYWPKTGVSILGYNKRLRIAKDELFLAKLSGGKE
jgi:hypothetical protein